MRNSMESWASTTSRPPLPLNSLNHVSMVCKSVEKTKAFYRDVLGFVEIKRPSSFDFEGSWLFQYGIGIHLIEGQPIPRPSRINPKSDHLSFQSESLDEVARRLEECGILYERCTVMEGGVRVSQLFFHDPENHMIEICNCDCLPLVPLAECCSGMVMMTPHTQGTACNVAAAAAGGVDAMQGSCAPGSYCVSSRAGSSVSTQELATDTPRHSPPPAATWMDSE